MASPGTQCTNPNFPLLCANGQCVQQGVCNSSYVPGSSLTTCCDPTTYLTPTSSCLFGFFKCANGLCVSKASFCPQITCPPDLPFLCGDGLCTFNYSTCNAANGCPFNAPYRCWDGNCSSGFSQYQNGCSLNPNAPHCIMPDTGGQGVLCNYGGCALSASLCPNSNAECQGNFGGCSCGAGSSIGQDETVCMDRVTCAPYVSSSQTSMCLATTQPGPNQCTPDRPYRCDDGYCAVSSVLCVSTDPLAVPCPSSSFPFRCASGECVVSGIQCPVITSCNVSCSATDNANGVCSRYVRCNDGTCRKWPNYGMYPCPLVNTCPASALAPTQYLSRCTASGLCVADTNNCVGNNGDIFENRCEPMLLIFYM